MKRILLSPAFAKFAIVLGASLFAVGSIGCETTEGAGRDVERLGDKIEDAAD